MCIVTHFTPKGYYFWGTFWTQVSLCNHYSFSASLPHSHIDSPVWWHTAASHNRTRSPGTVWWGRRQTGRWCKRCYLLSWLSSRQSRWSQDLQGHIGSNLRVAARSRWGSRPRTGRCPGRSYGSWRGLPQWEPSWCCSVHRRGQPGRWGTQCLQEERQGTHICR